jgi:hypothetical protein
MVLHLNEGNKLKRCGEHPVMLTELNHAIARKLVRNPGTTPTRNNQ